MYIVLSFCLLLNLGTFQLHIETNAMKRCNNVLLWPKTNMKIKSTLNPNNLSLQKHLSSFKWLMRMQLASPISYYGMIYPPPNSPFVYQTWWNGLFWCINKMVMVTSQVSSESKLFFFSIMRDKKPFPFMLELQTHQVCSYGWHTSSSLSIMLGQKPPNR